MNFNCYFCGAKNFLKIEDLWISSTCLCSARILFYKNDYAKYSVHIGSMVVTNIIRKETSSTIVSYKGKFYNLLSLIDIFVGNKALLKKQILRYIAFL